MMKTTLVHNEPMQDNDESAIDLASFLDLLIDNRWLVAIIALIVGLLGSAYAIIAKPIYEANILIQVEDNANSSTSILGEFANAFDMKSPATAEIEILRSRFVLTRAINNAKLDLTVKPVYFPLIGSWLARNNPNLSQPGLLGYGGYAWGSEHAEIGVFQVSRSLEGEPFVLTVTGKETFRFTQKDANVDLTGHVGELIKKDGLWGRIELRVDRLVANAGAQFVVARNPMIDTIEELQKKLVIGEKGKQSGIIALSLEGADPQKTAQTLNEIAKEYLHQNVERKSEEAEKSLAFLEQQLPQMKATVENAESKYNAFRNSRGTVDLDEEAKTILQQSVSSQTKLLELKQKRDELLTRYQESNPMVQAVAQQIRTLNDEIQSVNAKIRRMPSVEQDVLRLTRDVKVNTDLYTSLLNSAQQLRLVKASRVGNARLLDTAVPPIHPVRPKRVIVIPLAIVVGLIAGVLAALLKKSVTSSIEDPSDVEQALGHTVSAAIPFAAKQESIFNQINKKADTVSVLAQIDPTDPAIESLRSFRTSLQFSMLGAKNNIVMIAGPTPGVGKSFVSVNFAAVIAATGKRVLLIDADLRKGYLNRYFGRERENGLSEAIAGQISLSDATNKSVVDHVDFISTGTLPPRPSELLEHENFSKILCTVSSQYDIVIIDTAPILAVSDSLIVARHAGTIFNVVRGEVSTIGEIDESCNRLKKSGHSFAGIVFNGLKPRAGRFGYKYGKYSYVQYKY